MTSEVVIHFCRTCGFNKPAEQIAEAVRRELGLTVECRPGFWGCFRVEHNGQAIFSRWKTRGWLGRLGWGRTPTSAEIVELLQQRSKHS